MSGDIVIDGRNISGMKPDDVRKSILGTEIAYIPQAAMNALNPTQRIIRFIEDVVRAHDPKKDKKLIRELRKHGLRNWVCRPRCWINTRWSCPAV